jgi:hypothetical protein
MLNPTQSTSTIAALTSIYVSQIEKIFWAVCLLLWLVGGLVSGWVFIPAVLLTLYLAAFFYSNNSAKWRRFYFRISMIYAHVAGAQLLSCQEQEIPFDPDMAWRHILQSIYLDKEEVEAFFLVRDQWRKGCDPNLFRQIARKMNPAASQAELDSGAVRLTALFQDEKPGRKVIVTKGCLIQKHFGSNDYEAFWTDVFRGKIN